MSNMRKIRTHLLLFLVLSLGGSTGVPSASAEPFVPPDDAQVLERLPTVWQTDPRMRQVRRWRAELVDDEDNLELALRIATTYLEIGRSEGDPRYMGYAQATLRRWWDVPQPPPGLLLLRALVRQNRHDFNGALGDLNRLLRLQPRNTQAWLTRAVIQQVQGDHDAAMLSCRPVRRANPLLATACLASVGSFSGRAESSYEMLLQALVSFSTERVEDRLWALTGLAEIATRLGRSTVAERHFRDALALDVRDIYLLAAYADFLLDEGRPQEVLTMLDGETRADALLLRRALAASKLETPTGSDLAATLIDILGVRFTEGRLRGDRLHLGAESRFHLHLLRQPEEALRLALDNWTIQREPIDARHVLAAAVAAGDREAARPVTSWIAESGLEDVRLTALMQQLEEIVR